MNPSQAQTDFERLALDHAAHVHCSGCGGCIVDPSHAAQGYQVWCIGCRDRIKANLSKGGGLPWGVEFVEGIGRFVSGDGR